MLDFSAGFEKQTFRRLSLNTATRHLRIIIRLTSSSVRYTTTHLRRASLSIPSSLPRNIL